MLWRNYKLDLKTEELQAAHDKRKKEDDDAIRMKTDYINRNNE